MSSKMLFIIFGLCSVLALAICMVVVIFVTKLETTEGTYEFEEVSPLMESSYTPDVDYLNRLLANATDENKVFITHTNDFSISRTDDGENSSETASTLINRWLTGITDRVNNSLPTYEAGEFGKESELPMTALKQADVTEFNVQIGTRNSETDELENGEYYYFDITLDMFAEDVPNCQTNADVFFEITEEIGNFLNSETNVETKSISIKGRVNGVTEQIDYLTFERVCDCTFTVGENEDYNNFAQDEVYSFEYTVSEKFDFSYAGIEFTEDTVYLSLNEDTALGVSAVLNDYAEYEVSFKSSDESRVTIDEQGYAKGLELSDQPVEITVTLEYLGNTYTDTCLVYVTEPVEKIKISDTQLNLSVGDTATLTAELTPDDATIKDIIWLVEGDCVEVEDGKVTAINEGSATVIAVSKDGFFRASCQITVKGA